MTSGTRPEHRAWARRSVGTRAWARPSARNPAPSSIISSGTRSPTAISADRYRFEFAAWLIVPVSAFGSGAQLNPFLGLLVLFAVGAAVGKNPVSFVVPCHRVMGKSGDITGYHWGLTRKRAMLGWEAGRVEAA